MYVEPRLISQANLVAVSKPDGSYVLAAEEGNAGGRLSLLETSLCLSLKPDPIMSIFLLILSLRLSLYPLTRFLEMRSSIAVEGIRAVYSTEVTLFNNKFGTKIPNLETLGSPIRRGQKKMLPFLGNTLAKSCRKGRLQCRDFSSGSEKAVSKVYRYCFTAVFGGAGFLLGGVTTSPVSKGLREYEERFVKGLQRLEKMEARRGKWTSSLKEETK
ncbi:hypothetical protein Bca101_085527 [Brassica carinata]